jgi:hypothetical protein
MPTERPVISLSSGLHAQRQLPPAPTNLAQRLPWILVGALGVALAALVAYIVLS